MQRGGQAKYVPNGRAREVNKGSRVPPAASNSVAAVSQGSEMLSSMLAAASPEQQKTILGERLYPLVQKHQVKINSHRFFLVYLCFNISMALLLSAA